MGARVHPLVDLVGVCPSPAPRADLLLDLSENAAAVKSRSAVPMEPENPKTNVPEPAAVPEVSQHAKGPHTLHHPHIRLPTVRHLVPQLKDSLANVYDYGHLKTYTRRHHSYYLFSPENSLRSFMYRVEKKMVYVKGLGRINVLDMTMILIVCVNLLTMVLELDNVKPFDDTETALGFEIGFTCFYTCELIIRSISHGFVIGRGAYLSSVWNRIDFVSLVSAFVELAIVHSGSDVGEQSAESGAGSIRVLKLFRVLRAARALNKVNLPLHHINHSYCSRHGGRTRPMVPQNHAAAAAAAPPSPPARAKKKAMLGCVLKSTVCDCVVLLLGHGRCALGLCRKGKLCPCCRQSQVTHPTS